MDPHQLIPFLREFEQKRGKALHESDDIDFINDLPVAPLYLSEDIKKDPLISLVSLPKPPKNGTGRPSLVEKGTVTRLRYAMSIWQRRWQYTLKANGMSMENARARILNFYNNNLDTSGFPSKAALTLSFKTLDDQIVEALKTLIPNMGGVKQFQLFCNTFARGLKVPKNINVALLDWEIVYANILTNINKGYKLAEELDRAMRSVKTKKAHGSALLPGENGEAGSMDIALWTKDSRYRIPHELQIYISFYSLTNLSMLFPHYHSFEPLNEIGVHLGYLIFCQPPTTLSQNALAIIELWLDECRQKGAAALKGEDDYTRTVRFIFDFDQAIQGFISDQLKTATPNIYEMIKQAIAQYNSNFWG